MEVLCTKHPNTRSQSAASLETYPDRPLELVPVARKLSGGAGPAGTDLVILQHWLLRFEAASRKLQLTVEDFAEWLGNG